MNEKKYLSINLKLRAPDGSAVDGIVIIKDGWAISNFRHPTLAKELYIAEKKRHENVSYDAEKKYVIQKYANKTKEQIMEIIKKELNKSGGKFLGVTSE